MTERHDPASPTTTTIPGEATLGRTELGDVGEVSKYDIRLGAFGDCEEANASVGTALAFGAYDVEVAQTLTSLQNDLFDLAADLSAPLEDSGPDPVRIAEEHIAWVERAWSHYGEDLSTVDGYVLPGGTVAASLLFQARVAVRRAERTILRAMDEYPDSLNPLAARYLNGASSLLFALARCHNAEHGDTQWRPLASITPPE